MNRSLRRAVLISLAFLLALSFNLGIRNENNEAAAATPQKVLRVATALQPSTLDVAVGYDAAGIAAYEAAYEKLVRYKGGSTEIEPELATSWSVSKDGKVWTFKLRKGVKFHDGTPFNSAAVKFSYDRVKKINQGPAWMFDVIDKIDTPDDYTVRFALKQPFSPFLQVLANIFGTGIVSPTAVKAHEKDQDFGKAWLQDHMVGTGPYKLVEWAHGEKIVLERNKDYWRGWNGKPTSIDKVIISFISEPSTQRMLLEKGDLDIAMNIAIEDLKAVSGKPGIHLVEKPTMHGTYIRFNTQKKPLDDARVRKAIIYAFDWDSAIRGIMNGHAIRMQGPAALSLPGHNDDLPVYKQDMAKARELLAKAGYPNGGFTLQYVYETGQDDRRKVGELLLSNLAELGIKVEIKTMPWESIWNLVSSPNKKDTPDMTANGWWPDYADVLDYLYPMYHSSQVPPTSLNIGFYSSKEADELMDKAMKETNETLRLQYLRKAQEVIVNDAPDMDLYQKTSTIMIRDWVKGYVYNPLYSEGYNLYDMNLAGR